MVEPDEWVTIAEAARRLGIDPRQVRRYADKLRGTQDRTPSDTSPVRVRMRAIEALRNGFAVKLSIKDTLSGQGQDRTGHPRSRSPLPDYAALLSEKDARIADLQEQLRERNQAESELRRLMLADKQELQELRQRLALPPATEEQTSTETVKRPWWHFWDRTNSQ